MVNFLPCAADESRHHLHRPGRNDGSGKNQTILFPGGMSYWKQSAVRRLKFHAAVTHIGGATSDCQVWPLQLIYHDIAWYLIYEYCNNGHLAVGRVNPSRTTAKFLLASQFRPNTSLQNAHKLIENGWGFYLGEPAQQQTELQSTYFETVKVRFFPPVMAFIEEGKRRHHSQKSKSKDSTT